MGSLNSLILREGDNNDDDDDDDGLYKDSLIY